MTLRAVDEEVLARLVEAAVGGASANEVTPPLTTADAWSPERIDWLRRFHRDRRPGSESSAWGRTWAVVVAGDVVGSVRLEATAEPGILETGIWLTRAARGRGVGRQALAAALAEAWAHGAAAVRADTSRGNGAALAVLGALGFRCDIVGDRVTATIGRPAGDRDAAG